MVSGATLCGLDLLKLILCLVGGSGGYSFPHERLSKIVKAPSGEKKENSKGDAWEPKLSTSVSNLSVSFSHSKVSGGMDLNDFFQTHFSGSEKKKRKKENHWR